METGNYKETGANLATALQLIQKLAVNPAIGKATPAEIVNELYKELLELCEEQIPDSTKH